MGKRVILKDTKIMVAIHIRSDHETEIVQALKAAAAACLYLWWVLQMAVRAACFVAQAGGRLADRTWLVAEDILAAAAFGYQVAGIRARSMAWGVLNL